MKRCFQRCFHTAKVCHRTTSTTTTTTAATTEQAKPRLDKDLSRPGYQYNSIIRTNAQSKPGAIKIKSQAIAKRRIEILNELPSLMTKVQNQKLENSNDTNRNDFERIFFHLFNTFCMVMLHNKKNISSDLLIKNIHKNGQVLLDEYRKLTFGQRKDDDKKRFPWDRYTDYQEYCQSPPMILSIPAIKEGFIIQSNRDMFYQDTFKALSKSFMNYVGAKVENLDGLNVGEDVVDMTNPAAWYPAARAIPRKVYLHIGPTNSGKTYNALQKFKESNSGFYAGPLRLLAKEVYNRMKGGTKPCSLITGEEIIEEMGADGLPTGFASGTVEMINLKNDLDIAIIDEIQMIEDRDRGWAWTHAFLGVRAKEVHCCGDPSSENIIRRLCELTGDKLEIVRYERLSPLNVDEKTLNGNLGNIKEGDCLVAFSKKELFRYKIEIEQQFKKKCAVIYGSLPADTRSEQAMRFNDPDSEYKYLVASDAIGMGLNLAIKRVVFSTVHKFDGVQEIDIPIAQTKQIGGRAGRYKIATNHSRGSADPTENVSQEETGTGSVTTLHSRDIGHVKKCMSSETPKITRAGLFPQEDMLREFAMRVGMDVPFYQILQNLQVNSRVSGWFFFTDMKSLVETAKLFTNIPGLLFEDMLTLCKAPVQHRSPVVKQAFQQFVSVIARGESVNILEIPDTGLHHLQRVAPVLTQMSKVRRHDPLEDAHRVLNLYLWLSYRFPINLLDRKGAFELKQLCEEKISAQITATKHNHKKN